MSDKRKINWKQLFIFTSIVSIISSKISYTNKENNNTCLILALEGGGDKGAYQAGAIKGLMGKLETSDVNYNYITGISLGAINAALLSSYDPGNEKKQAAEEIVNLWQNIQGERDIYKNWFPFGILSGLNKESLYKTDVLKKNLEEKFKEKQIKRNLIIGATNANTGDYEYFDNSSFETQPLTDALMASTAFPVIFPARDYLNKTYYDGIIKRSFDAITGINKCRENGFKDENIKIDIIMCNSYHLEKYNKKEYRPLNALERFIEISAYDLAAWDLDNLSRYYPKVSIRHMIQPSEELPSSFFPYEFDEKQIDDMINLGMKDAANE